MNFDLVSISTRSKCGKVMPCFELGPVGTGYVAATVRRIPSDKETERAVKSFHVGLNNVTFPIGKERHSIAVDLVPGKHVAIIDWAVDELVRNVDEDFDYYRKLLSYIWNYHANESTPLKFAELDEVLYEIADEKAQLVGGGGCAEYVDLYRRKYFPGYY
jgi:hypothetical protein